MIMNDGFYHSDHRKQCKVKWFQNFTSQVLKTVKRNEVYTNVVRVFCPQSNYIFCHWTSGESIRYSKRLIVSDLVDLSTFYIHAKTSFYF